MMYTYKDINNLKKIRRTRGKFAGWTRPTGIVNIPYAIFRNRCSDILVPEYLLTPETTARIAEIENATEPVTVTRTL